jgi:uncharacterized protein YkwD
MYKNLTLIFCLFILVSCLKKDKTLENIKLGMLIQVNELRQNGCRCGSTDMPPVNELKWNTSLENAAALHAKDMFDNKYFGHIGLNGSSPIQRAQLSGYKGKYVGENIAKNYSKITDVVNGWRNSETHCKAMMDTLYLDMGVAKFGNYWVQELGR